ncbi:MAG: endonuclease III [Peptococcaceae bacterium]|nr:endonuclease III [Peptococcaceae bacterium]
MNKEKERLNQILAILAQVYPDAACGLNFRNPFELLIATILSAQTTDQKVNQVTAELFRHFPTPQKIMALSPEELEKHIRVLGLFRTKAKNIVETCRILTEQYKGSVPPEMAKLVQLPGVGRKTAGVVLANAFGIPAFPVDTHVRRVANRLGLSASANPSQVEKDLTALIEKNRWIDYHHRFIAHGRTLCQARKPKCHECPLSAHCPISSHGL